MISSMFWTPEFRNNDNSCKLHYHFLSISVSFLYFLSRSARNKGNKKATGTGFEFENLTQLMDFRVLNPHLEVRE